MSESNITNSLFAMQDSEYKKFNCKLLPTVDPALIIGIRIPLLRKKACELANTSDAEAFMSVLPHKYHEEYNLHGFLIEKIKDYDQAVYEMDRLLPYIDNWATCDLISPKIFGKHLAELRIKIKEWMSSERTYTIRFGIEMLMRFYLDKNQAFEPEVLCAVASVKSDEYYVKMMVAWFFATALAKQYSEAVKYFREQRLDDWTHNKAIQKAIESRRITQSAKDYLRGLKK